MNTEPQVVTKTPKVKKEKIQSPGRVVLNRLLKNKLAMVGLGIIIFMFLNKDTNKIVLNRKYYNENILN